MNDDTPHPFYSRAVVATYVCQHRCRGGQDEKTIRNIFHDYVAELEKTHVFQTPRWLGIDELLLERLATVYLDQRACGNHHWVTARPHQCHGDTVPERDARPPADRTGLHGYIG